MRSSAASGGRSQSNHTSSDCRAARSSCPTPIRSPCFATTSPTGSATPRLQLAFADGTGRWIAPSGEVHLDDLPYDRAITFVTRDGRPIGVLDHDIALSTAPDTLHTAAALAGLAFDANRLLAVSEGRLAETRRLGERLLGADIAMRAEMEELLDEGPIARLRACCGSPRVRRSDQQRRGVDPASHGGGT